VEYSDQKRQQRNLSYENEEPDGTIKFFKQVTVFGEPSSGNDTLTNNSLLRGLVLKS
jgi:hypothetical protein